MQIVNPFSDRLLEFGVPLEDMFLENDIHPALKNLFEAAFKSITKSGFPIPVIIRSLQGTLSERFLLKDQLLAVGYFSGDEASPGAYLWLIRLFLTSLLLPLLPIKTHNQRKPWNFLCELCEKLLQESCSQDCFTFSYSIARYINTLPNANRMLLMNFVNLSNNFGSEEAIECFADFFGTALFERQYFPGKCTEFCRHGYYFMIYLMLHWDTLVSLCKTPKGFKIQTFENTKVEYRTKIVRTTLPVLEGNVLKSLLLDFERKKRQRCAVHKTTQTIYQKDSERSFKCSSLKAQESDERSSEEGNSKKESPLTTKIKNVSPEVSGDDEYFYDEDYKEQANSFSHEATLDRIAKVGWTYTPSTSPRIGWNINKANYNLSFENIEAESVEEAAAPQEQTNEKRSQKSVVSLHSMPSKLKFWKKMRMSLCSVKKSTSTEDTACNIKYKKMESSRNNSF